MLNQNETTEDEIPKPADTSGPLIEADHGGLKVTAKSKCKSKRKSKSKPQATRRGQTKSATMLDLLKQPQGADMAELVAATGWQEHSIRAALSGLRKAGHNIERQAADTNIPDGDSARSSHYRITDRLPQASITPTTPPTVSQQ